MHENPTICVVGGSGFIGRYVVKSLAEQGFRIKVIARHAGACEDLKPLVNMGQMAFAAGDVLRPETVTRHFAGAYGVVNLTGILFEKGRQRFVSIHAHAAEAMAKSAKAAGVSVFVHMSALGVERATESAYASSKLLGEQAVRAAFPAATIIRPSVVFGAEDHFFNQFARLASMSPFLPLIGGGHTQFQPVYVGNVAETITQLVVQHPRAAGQIVELGGPQVMTFREILDYILKITGHKARYLTIPFPVAALLGRAAQLLPRPPLTRDQVILLKYHNVLSGEYPVMESLGLRATAVDSVVPDYLQCYQKRLGSL